MFGLFILLNLTLFLRPGEIVPALRGAPVYQVVILMCLVSIAPVASSLLSRRWLVANPINCCVTLLLLAVPLSHLSHGLGVYPGRAQLAFEQFGKVYLYFLVATAVLVSGKRIESLLSWLVIMIGIVAGLSLGHDRGLFTIPELASLERGDALDASGGAIIVQQLRGTGIFNDPNDLAMILTVGFVCAAHVLNRRQSDAMMRCIAIAVVGLTLFGLYETKSRGGILGFLAAGWVLVYARWGLTKAMITAGGVLVPLTVAIFAMRGGGGVTEGTALHRIHLWSEGLTWLKWNPFFGLGYNRFATEMGLVAHNSFVHCYTELGTFGGSLFLGAFFAAVLGIWRLWRLDSYDLPDENRNRLATVAACIIGSAVAMLTLSRSYVVPTYLLLALAASTLAYERRRLRQEGVDAGLPRFDRPFLWLLAKASFGFLLVTYLFVRTVSQMMY